MRKQNVENFTNDDYDLFIRTFTYYYENYVWKTMAEENNSKASDEDYKIRSVLMKLGIRDEMPDSIKQSW